MSPLQWKTKRVAGILIGLIFVYLFVRIKFYNYKASVTLENTRPSDVWEFVADFSNMKYLNPTVVDFSVIQESGNYDHWKYSTEYSEHLSHWPYLHNVAVAHFDVKASPKKDVYYVNSVHRTCLFNGYFCLNSKSEFRFKRTNSSTGTICEEEVDFQCPAFLFSFCYNEVEYQRKAIMKNLKAHFQRH